MKLRKPIFVKIFHSLCVVGVVGTSDVAISALVSANLLLYNRQFNSAFDLPDSKQTITKMNVW